MQDQKALASGWLPAQQESPEQAFIIAVRQGDNAAWTHLVNAHQAAVFRLAYLLAGDANEADDIAQEVFVKAYKHLHRFEANRPLKPWLLRITKNLANNKRRAAGRYWRALRRYSQAHPPPAADQFTDGGFAAQQLWQAVRRLRRPAQEVIYLRYFLELSEAETAACLDIPAGTVKSRLHRALKRLKGIVKQDYPHLEGEKESGWYDES